MEMRSLPVQLNPDELHQRAEQLAQRVKDLAAKDDERKQRATDYRKEIKDIKAAIESLAQTVKTGEEYRPIEVERVEDLARCAIMKVRKDTGATIDERPMTIDERQASLFPDGETAGVDDGGGMPVQEEMAEVMPIAGKRRSKSETEVA